MIGSLRYFLLVIFSAVWESSSFVLTSRPCPAAAPSGCSFQRDSAATHLFSAVNDDTARIEDQSTPDLSRSDSASRPSIHPLTLDVISKGLPIMISAISKHGTADEIDPQLVMTKIGDLTQQALESSKDFTPEELQVIGGRVVAVLTRLEFLEDQLAEHTRSILKDSMEGDSEFFLTQFGRPAMELSQESAGSESLRKRAAILLAWFLETLEGPALSANNVKVPCMDVDFLEPETYKALFPSPITQSEQDQHAQNMEALQETLNGIASTENKVEAQAASTRKSLHPLTVDILTDILKLRAQNDTKAPLRFLDDDSIEGWQILEQAGRMAETKINPLMSRGELDEQEAHLVGGRIVAIVMRIEDLEWELLHRCRQEPWIENDNAWSDFGVLVDEGCVRTLDERILQDDSFVIKRAERLLALFLLNLEGPGSRAAGDRILDGSVVDFLEAKHYKIMVPKTVRQ